MQWDSVHPQKEDSPDTRRSTGEPWRHQAGESSQSQQTTRRLHFRVTLPDREPQRDRRTGSVETRG